MNRVGTEYSAPRQSTKALAGHQAGKIERHCGFQMPLHYPRYTKSEYEMMPEWKLDCLLAEYGLPATGDVHQKRKFAMGAFLWQY